MRINVILACLLTTTFACKHHEKSDVKIVNGIETSEFPAVVHIQNIMNGSTGDCTGTFIKHNLLLTAAHCIEDGKVVWNGIEAKRFLVNDLYYSEGKKAKHDVALVEFPDNTAPGTLGLSSVPPKDGEQLTMVGFGYNKYSYDDKDPSKRLGTPIEGAGTKRVGYNTFRDDEWDKKNGMISFSGVLKNQQTSDGKPADGQNAAVASQDSGGPLIIKSGIIGVVSARAAFVEGKLDSTLSYYAYLLSKESIEFLAKAKGQGYAIDASGQVDSTPEVAPPPSEVVPDTPDTSNPPQSVPPASTAFNASAYKIEDTHGFEFTGIPVAGVKIEIYWGDDESPFEEISIANQSSYKTEYTWGLSSNPKVTIKVRDKNNTIIEEKAINLN